MQGSDSKDTSLETRRHLALKVGCISVILSNNVCLIHVPVQAVCSSPKCQLSALCLGLRSFCYTQRGQKLGVFSVRFKGRKVSCTILGLFGMGHGCKAMYLKAFLGSVPNISRNATFYRHSLILHNMMKQFQITSESSTVKEFPRCPCGMGWTPIRLLPSCIHWNPSFPSQVKYKECVLHLDTWFTLCCVWSYSHSEYKWNYLIPHFITIPNRGSSWTAHEVSEWHIVHCLASHRSWLIHKAEIGDRVLGTLMFWKTWDQMGLLGFPKRGPPQTNPVAPL